MTIFFVVALHIKPKQKSWFAYKLYMHLAVVTSENSKAFKISVNQKNIPLRSN
jgi:hypothetical protein